DGKDLSELPLTSLANLETVLVRVPDGYGRFIHPDLLKHVNVRGKAVLFHTGWSNHWNSEQYYEGHPFLTEETAVFLQQNGAKLVGIDSLNIDDTDDGRRPVHSTLLRHNIPIAEHLTNLHALPDNGVRFFAVPVKVKAFGTFPVRAFGIA
ncbi:MAG: cyclase family protein, partial [Chloroflexi bacterium]